MPTISIIMPLFNGMAHLPATVASVQTQTFSDYEVLLVDDGSADGGPEWVKNQRDTRWRIVSTGRNQGPAVARNQALALAQSEHVAFWDSDDLAAPNRLARQVEILSGRPEYDAAASWIRVLDQAGNGIAPPAGFRGTPEHLVPHLLFRNWLITSTLLVRRKLLDGQAFDPEFVVASDFEMWSRLFPPSRVFMVQEPLVSYREHAANITHRKGALLQDTLRRIGRKQIARLGLTASDEDLDVHGYLGAGTFPEAARYFPMAEGWLAKLQQANRRALLYDAKAFEETLGELWGELCWKAALQGQPTWRAFARSVLRQPYGYAATLWSRVAWANVKRLLKRSGRQPV